MKKISRLFGLAAVAAALAIALAVPAQAVVLQGDAYNNAYFQNAETVINTDGSTKYGLPSLTAGDVVYGILNVQNVTFNPANADGGTLIWQQDSLLPGLDTFTGYFAHVIALVSPFPVAPGVDLLFGNIDDVYSVISAPVADPNGILLPGEVMRLYTDAGTAYTDNAGGGFAADILNATDSPLWASLGTAGGYWYSLVTLVEVPGASMVGETYAGLNFMINNTGYNWALINDPDESAWNLNVQMFFNSELLATDPSANWGMASNDPARGFPSAIPEPTTVLLLGAGLVGLGLWGRKRMVK